MCCEPGNGSPPMPTHSDWPRPILVVASTASYVSVPERETTPAGRARRASATRSSRRRGRRVEGAGRTDRAGREDVAGHDADLAAAAAGRRGDDARAVGAHEARLGLPAERLRDLRTTEFRNQSLARRRAQGREGTGRRTRTSSCCGMPSVMQTMRGISASMASMMASAANGGGT